MTNNGETKSSQPSTNGSDPTPTPHQPQPGEAIFTLARDGRMRSRDEIIGEIQDYFCALAPAERVLSEELIADRRREFEQDEAENSSAPSRTRPQD